MRQELTELVSSSRLPVTIVAGDVVNFRDPFHPDGSGIASEDLDRVVNCLPSDRLSELLESH